MTMTDPISDMLTRIRNAVRVKKHNVSMPASRMKVGIARVLKDEGYIEAFEVHTDEAKPSHSSLQLALKYGPDGEVLIQHLQRFSKPGCRRYRGCKDIPDVLNGLGITILSTPKGVLSDREARKENVGGEVLCTVY
ncbi:MAG: 30S ribosomal protein S8 [Planctomycetota bacterium]|nr:MAG: 30S ribosomal protein S8 [Planctomycetota bacterium]